MTLVSWCAAGALAVISGALCRREVAKLSAANPAARLPWSGWPANTPRSAKRLQFFVPLPAILAIECVEFPLGRRPLYELPLGIALVLIVVVVMAVVPHAQHNRRIGSSHREA